MALWIKETFVNETKGHQFGESQWYETSHETLGDLFRALRSEYGPCISKQYTDRANKPSVQSGWVFRKRMEYEDYKDYKKCCGSRFYVREVWVSVLLGEPKLEGYRCDARCEIVCNGVNPWEVQSVDHSRQSA